MQDNTTLFQSPASVAHRTLNTRHNTVHWMSFESAVLGSLSAAHLPFPRHTSAKWQLPSPGSLQNSTTSRHVVSGVIGTSVRICSLLLRNTVNIICKRKDEVRATTQSHHRKEIDLSIESHSPPPHTTPPSLPPSPQCLRDQFLEIHQQSLKFM